VYQSSCPSRGYTCTCATGSVVDVASGTLVASVHWSHLDSQTCSHPLEHLRPRIDRCIQSWSQVSCRWLVSELLGYSSPKRATQCNMSVRPVSVGMADERPVDHHVSTRAGVSRPEHVLQLRPEDLPESQDFSRHSTVCSQDSDYRTSQEDNNQIRSERLSFRGDPSRLRSGSSNKLLNKQNSRLYLRKSSIWEILKPVEPEKIDDKGLQRRCGHAWDEVVWDFKAAKSILKEQPKLALGPLIITVALILLTVFGVLEAADIVDHSAEDDREVAELAVELSLSKEVQAVNDQRNNVDAVADELNRHLSEGLESAIMPLKMLELYVQLSPTYPFVEDNFPGMASMAMEVANLPGGSYSLGIAPFGVMSGFYPLANNEGAIGHDTLNHCQVIPAAKMNVTNGGFDCAPECNLDPATRCYPSRRAITYQMVRDRQLTLQGPIKSIQGPSAFIMRHPIFINTTSDPFGRDPYNETFGRGYTAHECTDACFNSTTGMRFWGHVNCLLSFSRWLELAGLERVSQRSNVAYRIRDSSDGIMLIESHPNASLEYISKEVLSYNARLVLDVAPVNGWLTVSGEEGEIRHGDPTGWKEPLLVTLVFLSLFLAMTLLLFVVNKRRHQMLLQSVLPTKVLPYVERGRNFCELMPSVTVLFSDIVSYTNISAEHPAMEILNMLNHLFAQFDNLVEKHHVYKVDTIGDAFMCASGIPYALDAVEGAESAANMALDMITVTKGFVSTGGLRVQIRVGLHTGPVVAAVLGLKRPHYSIFGDTVNVASRMESNGKPFRVHVSANTSELLQASPVSYQLTARGDINVKGKGQMRTYWLDTEDCGSSENKNMQCHGSSRRNSLGSDRRPSLESVPSTGAENGERVTTDSTSDAVGCTDIQVSILQGHIAAHKAVCDVSHQGGSRTI